jgi:hypothetical protein
LRLKYLFLLPCVAIGTEISAQRPSEPVPLAPGSRVRVKTPTLVAPLVANFLEQRSDTLVFIEDGLGRGVWSFSVTQIERLETTGGQGLDKRPIGKGAVIGGGIGLAAGMVFAAAATPSDPDKEYSRALTGALGFGVGAGLGALVGTRNNSQRWVNVPLPRRLSVGPHSRGGYAISFRFGY